MSRAFSLAGFEVTLIGRFWVTTEGFADSSQTRVPFQTSTCLFMGSKFR